MKERIVTSEERRVLGTVTDEEKKILVNLYREAVKEGSFLFTCKDGEQAERFKCFLNYYYFTEDIERRVGVIRQNQVNGFTVIEPKKKTK